MLPGFLKIRPAARVVAPALVLMLFALTAAGISCGGQTESGAQQDTLYQVSTIGALNTGVFEGSVDYATLRQHGDCGIGSFTGLDGEMVALDGVFYQVRTDGVPVRASDGQKAPYALVTFFQADITGTPPAGLDYTGLQQFAGGLFPSNNYFYAVRVEGEFASLKIRSVPGQQPPYPPLPDVVAQQVTWDKENIRGTMIGFFSPAYVGSVDPSGFHLHFISEDGQSGGHVLECRTGGVTVKLDTTGNLDLVLPEGEGFGEADLPAR